MAFETDVSGDNSGHILGVWGGEGIANFLRIYRQQQKKNSGSHLVFARLVQKCYIICFIYSQ